MNNLKEILRTEFKFLCFKSVKPDLERLGTQYLVFGVIAAWIAGVGRYWDNPRAEWWQYAGFGSVIYIVLMALVLWLITKPLKPRNWSYRNVLIFVGMTSPPGILYAIPVEKFTTLPTAQMINVWFLAIVAIWRVTLWILYLKRAAQLKGHAVFIASILPLAIIVTTLSFLNLEHVVFNIMAGLTEDEKTANDAAYGIVLLLTYFSVFAAPVLFIAYLINIFRIHKKPKIKTSD